jgi:two-component system sensor histidine kinase UhpB
MLLDEKGYVRDFNATIATGISKYMGKSIRRGMHYRELVLPENLSAFETDFQMALGGHAVHTTRSIKSRVVDILMFPLKQGSQRFVAYLGLDITVHHQLLETLEVQRELSELVANSLSEGILTLQKEAGLTYANVLAETILGPEITNTSLLAQLLTKPQGYLTLRDRLIRWETRPHPPTDLFLILGKDVTPLYKSEQENRVLREAWEIGPTGLALFAENSEGLSPLYVNSQLRRWFAMPPEQLWSQIQAHLSRDLRRQLERTLAAGEKGTFQLVGSYSKKGWSHLRLYLYPLNLPALEVLPSESQPPVWKGRLWIAIVQDETALHQLTRRRLLLEARQTQRILQAQEQERQHLAEALHDQVGAALSVTRMHLATLLAEAPPPLQEKLQTLLHQVDEVIRTVRLTSHLLMPPLVEHFSLQSIVEGLVRRFDQASHTMSFHLSVSGEEPPLTTQQKLAIYRVLQELLTNALKHSKATRVEVFLRFKARSLVLEVKDNGCGYDPRNPMGSGIGLRNIEARLKLLKATYHDRSEPGRGADFFMEVPLRRRSPTKARPS